MSTLFMNQEAFVHEYISKMKEIEENILQFLDNEVANDADLESISSLLDNSQIKDDKYKLKGVLRLISHISNNHHRSKSFFSKVEGILNIFHEDIQKYFTNSEIFRIFCKNKRILLYLFESKILIPDKSIFDIITQTDQYRKFSYKQYFYIEFKSFIEKEEKVHDQYSNQPINKLNDNSKFSDTQKVPEINEIWRKIGENDNYLCELIRNDLIEEFVSYVNRSNLPLTSQIKPSIFETNTFLLKNSKTSIIEYAAFYGSIQIFQYLKINKVKLS